MAAKTTIAAREIQSTVASPRSRLQGSTTLRPKIDAAPSSRIDPGTSASSEPAPASSPIAQGG